MATKNINATGDLQSKVSILEARIAALEKLSKKFTRRKREYTDEQKAVIRARLLAGQEMVRKRREAQAKAKNIVKPAPNNTVKPKQIVKIEKPANKSEPMVSGILQVENRKD